MELFTIERYTGEDTSKSEKPVESEDVILQKLIKKAEKRKRLKDKKENITENAPTEVLGIENATNINNADADTDAAEVQNDSLNIHSNASEECMKMDIDETTTTQDFQILGQDNNEVTNTTAIVNAALPAWLAHPHIISTKIAESSEPVDTVSYLSAKILCSLKKMNISKLFPVQSAIIPSILKGHSLPPPLRPRDICVSVPTGSGKTLAYAIPIVQILSEQFASSCKVRALLILPVGELALQVFKVFKQLCENTSLNVCLLSTQSTLRAEQEKLVQLYRENYYSKVDIIVTTPGRLVDHLHSTKGFSLKSLQFLVIDEADRIMDGTFQNWISHIDNHVKSDNPDHLGFFRTPFLCFNDLEMTYKMQPHKLLFSATLSPDPEILYNLGLFQPEHFTSTPPNIVNLLDKYQEVKETKDKKTKDFAEQYVTPIELDEKYCLTESDLKPLTLFALIIANHWSKFLCFTNSVQSSGRLTFVLDYLFHSIEDCHIKIAELSASLKAKERSNVLTLFDRGEINGVICSDALARGIDIPNVDVVICYDLPRHIKTYIHRIGRTARAGRKGTAVALLTQKEFEIFNNMLKEVSRILPTELSLSTDIEEIHANQYNEALSALREKIIKDKRLYLLQKKRAEEQQELLHATNMETKTLTEKLQLQASIQIHEKANENSRQLNVKKHRNKNLKKKTKRKIKEKL